MKTKTNQQLQLGANSYIRKPVDFDYFLETLGSWVAIGSPQ